MRAFLKWGKWNVRLIALLILIAFAIWYGGVLRSLVADGSWWWMSLMFVWPFVLAYYVGDDADRADFHKIRDWVSARLRIR